ncbi:MAG: hypothetical protein J5637_02690 [Prevotella sp.]|nr:hypothetical protein [Prevotella sp.]
MRKTILSLLLAMFAVMGVQAQVEKGYYTIKNNGNGNYINVLGRRTVGFASDNTSLPGTVYLIQANTQKTMNVGDGEEDDYKVTTLRSQGVDLPGYAVRGMKYVDEIVDVVVKKLQLEGEGELFGANGVGEILDKFHECFDYNLYLEPAGTDQYRIYGKTPSMQPVVEFYADHETEIREKLPKLEDKINEVIKKVLKKLDGRGTGILKPYYIHDVWERMGGASSGLTEPEAGNNDAILQFYDDVLTNEGNVWNFAYESVMMYWERVKASPTAQEYLAKLGDYSKYFDRIENIHPNFRYYIVADGNNVDFISQGNVKIQENDPSTIWTVKPCETFTKTFDAGIYRTVYQGKKEYFTTFYADFGYEVPDGCKAYAVTDIKALQKGGLAGLTEFEGVIPAQTPVLLMSTETSAKLEPSTASGTVPEGNLLVGPDYLINEYQIKTPIMETLFDMAKGLLGENSTFYAENIAQYEHLMLRNAGTVNNKYFFGISGDDLLLEDEEGNLIDPNLRVLGMGNPGDNILGFHDIWEKVNANEAFIIDEKDPVKLPVWPDIDRDGNVNVFDVTALIDIILETTPRQYEKVYDYDVADVDGDGKINVFDVTELIDIILPTQQ